MRQFVTSRPRVFRKSVRNRRCCRVNKDNRPARIGAGRTNRSLRVEPLQRERWAGERANGDAHQEHRIVVRGNPVAAQFATLPATMDKRPFAALANPNGDGFHNRAASGGPVSRRVVEVDAVQAIGAVVAVTATRPLPRGESPALAAGESVEQILVAGAFQPAHPNVEWGAFARYGAFAFLQPCGSLSQALGCIPFGAQCVCGCSQCSGIRFLFAERAVEFASSQVKGFSAKAVFPRPEISDTTSDVPSAGSGTRRRA